MKINNLKIYFYVLVILVIIVFIVICIRTKSPQYHFISGNVKQGTICKNAKTDFIVRKLQRKIIRSIRRGTATHISIFYKDLDCNISFEINGKEMYAPASLMKVPTLLAYYKQLELRSNISSNKLMFDKNLFRSTEYFPPKKAVQIGKTYEMDDLVKRMIMYSDNQAAELVMFALGETYLNQSDAALGLPTTYTSENFMTVNKIGKIFETLYDSSYLNQQNSEAALQLLSKTDFHYGIVAGVPKKVIISHKFGERENSEGVQLHDCGIVYVPKHPYIFCIMTKGKDMKVLMNVIKNISKTFYKNFTAK
ncbi:MAG TPA: serine hydrolase [Candidatus Saccharimonadales bacterium]|nr:serine hydrolase [Candidatus Saccharimonadales bacterium]